MRRNIAFLIEATLGGTRKHIIDLITNLPQNEFNIHLIYSINRADDQFLKNLENLKSSSIFLYEIEMNTDIIHFNNFKAIYKIRKYLLKNNIHIIHLHGAIAGGIGRISALMLNSIDIIIYTPHGGVFHKLKGLKGFIYLLLERFLLSKKLFFIAVSNSQRNDILKKLHVPESKVFLIHNGVEVPNFHISNSNKENFLFNFNFQIDNPFLILYPALFLEAKGHIDFFKSIKEYSNLIKPNIFFLLAGTGPLMEQTRSLVSEIDNLKSRVLFLGFIKEIDLYYELCDMVILPSKDEAFGYVVLEAFQHKKPIFSTRVGGLIDLIDDGVDGKFFYLDKINEFISDLNYYIEHKTELKTLGENGFSKLYSKFSIQKMIDKTVSIYKLKYKF